MTQTIKVLGVLCRSAVMKTFLLYYFSVCMLQLLFGIFKKQCNPHIHLYFLLVGDTLFCRVHYFLVISRKTELSKI